MQIVKATEEVQEMITSEVGGLLMVAAEGVLEDNADASKAVVPEASRGNSDSPHTENVIVVESDSTQSISSQSTFSSSSLNLDDIPVAQVYSTIHKGLSPTTKLHKKPADITPHEPLNSNIDERIIGMSQMKANFCNRLPANHLLKPPMIEPISVIPADAEFLNEHIGSESSNPNVESSSHPSSTNQTPETSVLDNLVNHYSGELPGVEPNSQRASEVASMEVALESPAHQAPNSQTASITHPDVFVPEQVASEHTVSEQIVPEQTIPHDIEFHPSIEKISERDFMLTSDDFDVEVE
jgi:hypothetical protein